MFENLGVLTMPPCGNRYHENLRLALEALNTATRMVHFKNECPDGAKCKVRGQVPTSPSELLELILCAKSPGSAFFHLECALGSCTTCGAGVNSLQYCEKELACDSGKLVRTLSLGMYQSFRSASHLFLFKIFVQFVVFVAVGGGGGGGE
jgi:hypothetical protein